MANPPSEQMLSRAGGAARAARLHPRRGGHGAVAERLARAATSGTRGGPAVPGLDRGGAGDRRRLRGRGGRDRSAGRQHLDGRRRDARRGRRRPAAVAAPDEPDPQRLGARTMSLVAEAGAILANVHDAAAGAGRRFPLSLGAKGSATVGGLVSTNAGGTQVLRFGHDARAGARARGGASRRLACSTGCRALRKDNRGYDLKQLLIGAEGTLGVVTAASLRLVAAIGARAVAWVGAAIAVARAGAAALSRGPARRGGGELRAGAGDRARSRAAPRPGHARAARIARSRGTCWSRRWRRPAAPMRAARLEAALGAALEAGSPATPRSPRARRRPRRCGACANRSPRPSGRRARRPSTTFPSRSPPCPPSSKPRCRRSSAASRARGSSPSAISATATSISTSSRRRAPTPIGATGRGAAITRIRLRPGRRGGRLDLGRARHRPDRSARRSRRTAEPARLALQRRIKAALDPAGIMNPGKLFP